MSRKRRNASAAVGIVLHVDGIEHGGGGAVGFFVGVDGGDVLHAGADVVQALQKDFLAGRSDFKLEHQAMLVGDGLVRQIDRQRIAFFFFGVLEKLLDLIFGQRSGKNAILEAVVVENVGIAGRDDDAEAVVLDAPGRVFAARAAAEIGAREQNRGAFVAR